MIHPLTCPTCGTLVEPPMTITEAAKILRVHRDTVMRWLTSGRLELHEYETYGYRGRYLLEAASVRALARQRSARAS